MSKLFKLKEFLTLEEAANHISTVLGETATIADLYRFALDGHLTLSVNFVNHANVKKGKWVKTKDIEFKLVENSLFAGTKFDKPYKIPANYELHVTEDDWISLEKTVTSIDGIWDLTMAGGEKLDIEHYYQQLTSGLEVTLCTLDGIFVQRDNVVCQLQQDFDDNEYQDGSKAQQEIMERYIANNQLNEHRVKQIRAEFKEDRKKYLEERKSKPNENNYFPSGGLDEQDHVLVIRTNEITRFIQSLESPSSSEKPLTSKERNSLLVLIGALCKQVDIDHNQRGIASSLVAMTEIIGSPLTDDTIRKILRQIDDAVALRNK